jgi:hypothetical protein
MLTSRNTATRKAWKQNYLGKAQDCLLDTIEMAYPGRATGPYANFIPIIQSSGMGKLRTVDEVAKTIFTLPINLCVDDGQ